MLRRDVLALHGGDRRYRGADPRRDLAAAIALFGDPAELPLPQRNFRGGRFRNLVIVVVFGLLPPLLIGTFGLVLPPRAKGVYARNVVDEVFG